MMPANDCGAHPSTFEGVEIGRSYVGESVPRVEDRALVTGAGSFVADVAPPDRLEAAFVRSRVAHGRIRSIDVTPALAIEGVVGAWDASGLDLRPMGFPMRTEAPDEMKRPPLATDRVRYVGDPIAVVVAGDRYAAEDGVAAVDVDVEPLAPVLEPADALREDAPSLFDGVGNLANHRRIGGSVDETLAGAEVVVTARYRNERVVPTSIETHGIIAIPVEGGLEVVCSHQAPHRLRGVLATALGLPPAQVRVIVPDVGGAFGSKSQTFPEYLVVARLALDLDRPVRWIEDRAEAFVATTHGRGQHHTVTIGAGRDGRLRALKVEIDADIGAYPHTGEHTSDMTMWVLSGCYAIPEIHAEARPVVTNKTPTASYRGAGRPEAAFSVERTMDALARVLGLDPADLRRRNFIPEDAFPYRSATGAIYDSGRYAAALDRALEVVGYEELRTEQRRRREADEAPLGIGICSYIERSGGSTGSTEHGSVEVTTDGRIVARSGTASQGQGHRTALAQIVASALDVDIDSVEIAEGDTAAIAAGTGTFGSRSIQVGGGALQQAAARLLERARASAASSLGVDPDALDYRDGTFSGGHRSLSLADVAARDEGLSEAVEFSPPQAFPFGTHVAVVEIDRETGVVHLLKLVAVDDCGEQVNPQLVRGQAVGSSVQGIGQALFEAVGYAEDGTPTATSFFSYGIPTAAAVPEMVHDHTVTPNPNVSLGTKGAGESGCIGTPPAIVNAVADALELGPEVPLDMPLLPEKIWRLLRRGAVAG